MTCSWSSCLFALCIAAYLTACVRDNAGPSVSPTIEFLTTSGYTFSSDTVGTNDTLLVGVVIRKGDDRLTTFKVLAKFDGSGEITTDSLSVGTEPFVLDKTIITRAQAGTEKWSFWVQENDGDIYRRSLTFTVQ